MATMAIFHYFSFRPLTPARNYCLLLSRVKKTGLKLNIQKTNIMASSSITSWQTDGETMETVTDFIFWAPKSLQMVTEAMKLKDAFSLEEKLWPNESILKSSDITVLTEVCGVYGFSSGHAWMWELDYKESPSTKDNPSSKFCSISHS